ncbi:glial cell line-derived neurotrophic factor [Chanos chanos]|uniref:Glial cell line-derived neurotrophic factor n=1 Tax=Chanos chanos TaxID=29144 RepID=A0A6J2WUE7_CHACN|nr:glial cell line-derived neurotrophic factor-like [Chanos chanos]
MALLHPDTSEEVLAFIQATVSRLKRSYQKGQTDANGEVKRERGKERRKSGRGRRGCVLKRIQLNVSDLGLGFRSKEELFFSYCTGACTRSLTNYDKILNSLTRNRSLFPETPPHVCCRPVAYDDDLSFLDDDLIYHTMRMHSARQCGCV